MILGAGIYQVPLIETAKRMGIYTIVASIPGEYPGFALADKVYRINTTDHEAILDVCRREQVNGICTSGTDVAVHTIGFVCAHMNLNGLSENSALCATDKKRMKEAFLQGGVCTADFRKVHTFDEARKAAEEIGYPVVVKRVDSSGSRGITLVDHASGLISACKNALEGSKKSYFLVENALQGTEIGVDGMVQNKKLVFLAPHEKFVYHTESSTIPAGHSFPLPASGQVLDEITRQMQLAVKALDLDNCSINADVFVNGSQVSVIEIGGRTGATCIPELISLHYGFDYYETILKNALGEPISFPSDDKRIPCMARLLMSPVHGTITGIDQNALSEIRQEGVIIQLDFPEGHAVESMKNGTTRIGHVIAETGSIDSFEHILQKVYSCIRVNGTPLDTLWSK